MVSVRRSGKRDRNEKRLFLEDVLAVVEVEELRGTEVDAVRPVSAEPRGVWRTLMAERRVLSLLKDILRVDLFWFGGRLGLVD
jgi:hypothetical protein